MKKSQKRKLRIRFGRFLFTLFLLFFIAFFFSGGIWVLHPRTWQHIGDFLPRLDAMPWQDRASRFLFIRRAVDARVDRSRQDYVPIRDIPDSVKEAIVAVEDNRFYSHHGFDPQGIARAALVNLQYGTIEEGASTITQQLVKNLFLSHEQTMGRKAEELLLALDIEANYSKDEILELYLNTIYYGSNFYGIGQASQGYFGKKPKDLQLPESAMLAGVPNAPSVYSPYVDFMMAKKRQIVVLDAMVRAGYIDKTMAEDAKIKPITLAQ